MIISLLGFFIISFLVGCGKENTTDSSSYEKEIQEWRVKRFERLKSPTGWLSLAGLYWLEEGENTFGSDSSNRIVFPPKAPPRLGVFILSGQQVTLKVDPSTTITTEGKPITEMVVYQEEMEKPVIMEHGALSWFIIKRGNKLGVRLRDSENPKIAALKPIDYYPIDPAWRIQARFVPYAEKKYITIENILGMKEEEASPGKLVFEYQGETYSLETLDSGDELFVIFRDATSGEETYGLGRYLYVQKPAPGETTWIDFNKAYNPPCAYTDYATCPIPPPENHLPFPVTAGEKYAGHHH